MRSIRSRRGARSQQKQLLSLQRQVRRNSTKLKDVTQFCQYTMPVAGTSDTSVTLSDGSFEVIQLIRPNQWGALFQTNPLTGSGSALTAPNKCRFHSMDLQFVFSPTDSEMSLTPRILRLWVVKLRPETAQQTLADTVDMSSTGFNSSANANEDLIYTTATTGGLQTMVKLNPAAFNILAYREMQFANIMELTGVTDEDTDITSRPAVRRCRIKLKLNNKIKATHGSWREMLQTNVMPEDRYYVITHVGGWDNGTSVLNGITMDTNFFINCISSN